MCRCNIYMIQYLFVYRWYIIVYRCCIFVYRWYIFVYSIYLFTGAVTIMTSPDDPPSVLPKLKHKSTKDTGMLTGVFKQIGDRVSVAYGVNIHQHLELITTLKSNPYPTCSFVQMLFLNIKFLKRPLNSCHSSQRKVFLSMNNFI